MKNKTTKISVILIIVLLLGFYFTLSNIQDIKHDTQVLQENLDTLYKKTVGETVTPGAGNNTATSTNQNNQTSQDFKSIPTAIIFQSQSSPLLEPQTNLTITLEEVSKAENGIVNLDIKVYTNEASSFSAVQPNNLFELISFSSANQKPLKIQGNFNSMPPQSKVEGNLTFKAEADQEEIILQIQTEDGLNHYRFNFEDNTYEKVILG